MVSFTAVLASILVIAALVTKTVDFIRNIVDKDDSLPKATWNFVALVVGVAYCLGWQVDIAAPILALVPALAEHASRLTGVAGQVFTGLLAGGAAGFLHELFDNLSAGAKMKSAKAKSP